MLSLIPLSLPPHLHPDLELRDVPGSGLCVDDSDDSEAEEREVEIVPAARGAQPAVSTSTPERVRRTVGWSIDD